MHRQTPLTAGYVGYTGSGARSLVDKVDDEHGMQEMNGSQMFGETREKVESPQNYGFTSVVLPAKKGKDGQIEECAEAYMSYLGGNRAFPVATVMDDRRHRPWALKPGENAQYDDIGQMTLMRRNGLYLLTLDSEDTSQQSGGATPGQQAESSGGQGKKVERMVSLRHVEKKKQERPKGKQQSAGQSGGGGGATATQLADSGGQQQSNGKDHKHEGETVNTEIRCTKNRIEFRTGDKVKGYYDVKEDKWHFTSKEIEHKATEKLKNEAPSISHKGTQYFDKDIHVMQKVFAMDGLKPGNGDWGVGTPSAGPSLHDPMIAGDPAPLPTDVAAYVARKQAQVDALEARLAKMEARLAALEAR